MPVAPPSVCKYGVPVSYQYEGGDFVVTEEMKQVFDWDGCIVVRGLFSKEEIDKIENVIQDNKDTVNKYTKAVPDGIDGKRCSKLLLWNQPGDDVTGMVGRCQKVVDPCAELLGGEVYHYHTKLMMKEARTGGRHLWHQDYGYWYQNGCLRPDLMTAFIAVDQCSNENGCLQVILGSHLCGRIDHDGSIGQQQADEVMVEDIRKHMAHVSVPMNPGDCLFFHSNVLHKSERNDSDKRRWCFLVAFNRADNDPVKKHHHPNYTPLIKVPNSAIMDGKASRDMSGKDYLDPRTDQTIKGKRVGDQHI